MQFNLNFNVSDKVAQDLLGKLLVEAKAANWILKYIARGVRRLNGPPSPVGQLTFRQTSKENSMLVYELDLPKTPSVPEAADVVGGRIRLSFDGADAQVVETAKDQTLATVKVKQGATVDASFVFVDDAGNESKNPLVLPQFTATDTIPPPDAVEGFGARLVSEEADA